ncbi:hypothetical protein F7725_018044 [Dissostichus mawsoni]|uniref:Uncharacterized protein n=1 Tax=Dissostichus mawsoni TaxID=36200 RepID=A0A7J5XRZ7_DISMA|nr:hypothetical protein F7725_018044 [Dissostichus mawsoni]
MFTLPFSAARRCEFLLIQGSRSLHVQGAVFSGHTSPAGKEGSELEHRREFPLGFEPLRSEQLATMTVDTSPVVKDPFCSPLLAPDSMLKGLPLLVR